VPVGRWPVGVVVDELALAAVAVAVDLVEHTHQTAPLKEILSTPKSGECCFFVTGRWPSSVAGRFEFVCGVLE
jgi:enoyl-[acyl-carrier-protein] reductase (NADH)